MSVHDAVMENKAQKIFRSSVNKARSEATFRFYVNNVSKLQGRVYSSPWFVRNLQWKILVMPVKRCTEDQKSKCYLGFYLECDGDIKYRSWSCNAVAELRLLSIQPEIPTFSLELKKLFSSKEKTKGYSKYMTWDYLVDPVKGYIKDDAITLEVHLTAEEPQDITYSRGLDSPGPDGYSDYMPVSRRYTLSGSMNNGIIANDDTNSLPKHNIATHFEDPLFQKNRHFKRDSNNEYVNQHSTNLPDGKNNRDGKKYKNEDKKEKPGNALGFSHKKIVSDSTYENCNPSVGSKNKDQEETSKNVPELINKMIASNINRGNGTQQPKNISGSNSESGKENYKNEDKKDILSKNAVLSNRNISSNYSGKDDPKNSSSSNNERKTNIEKEEKPRKIEMASKKIANNVNSGNQQPKNNISDSNNESSKENEEKNADLSNGNISSQSTNGNGKHNPKNPSDSNNESNKKSEKNVDKKEKPGKIEDMTNENIANNVNSGNGNQQPENNISESYNESGRENDKNEDKKDKLEKNSDKSNGNISSDSTNDNGKLDPKNSLGSNNESNIKSENNVDKKEKPGKIEDMTNEKIVNNINSENENQQPEDNISDSNNESGKENDKNEDKKNKFEKNADWSIGNISSDSTNDNGKHDPKNSSGSNIESNKKRENNVDKKRKPGKTEYMTNKKIANNINSGNENQQPENNISDINNESDKESDKNEDKINQFEKNADLSNGTISNDKKRNTNVDEEKLGETATNITNDLTNSLEDIKKQSKQSRDNELLTDENVKSRGEINLLLLSETGVGKSTFINSIANYLTYDKFELAEKEKLRVLIPAKFQIEDKNRKRHDVSIGESDKNEFLNQGESATQDVKSYIFPIGKNEPNIRLIDTPGMGDTRGPDQDIKNCDYILNYIGNLRELHGICCLFKPLNSRNTVYFQYCITEILSRLDKSASKNIVFLFTNTRGANYSPGETYEILKKTVVDIRSKTNVEIPLDKNIFCFDNEAFRYLAATQKNIKLSAEYKEKSKESWTTSRKQFWRMLKYIKKVEPHLVQSTSAINEARRMVNQLALPLADISELIHDNIDALQKHQEKLDIENMSLEDLRNQMFMPVIDLQVVTLDQPTTACTAKKCSEIYKVGDKNKWHYKQRCHEPCYLQNVQADTIDNPSLMYCAAMNRSSKFCAKCGCSYRVHMHVYYMTTTIEQRIENSNALRNIDDKEKFLEEVKEHIAKMVIRKNELEREHDIIVTSCAKFTHFLQKNAITPFNDSYKDYIEYLMTREQTLGPKMSNKQSVAHLRKLLQKYEETKKLFDNSLKMSKESGTVYGVTSKEIVETAEKLYGLKHSGKKIKELYERQQASRKREHEYTEYIHSPGPRSNRNNKGKLYNGKKEGGCNNDVEKQHRSDFKESEIQEILKDFFSFVSDNREGVIQRFVSWRTLKQKGKGPLDFQNRSTQNCRNVTKDHGVGLPLNSGHFYFGNNRSFLNSQPTSGFVPYSPEQYCQNANVFPGPRNNSLHGRSFYPYSFSDSYCNVPVNQLQTLQQQIIDMYTSLTAATNSDQYNNSYMQNTNSIGRNLNNTMPNYENRYHQQNPPPRQCFEQMADHSDSQRYNDNHMSSSTIYYEDSEQQNAYASYFNNERQHPQTYGGYGKVTGFSDQNNPSTDQASNFNYCRQQNYPQSNECDNGNGSLSENPYDLLRDYHQGYKLSDGRQPNYLHREDKNHNGAINFNRRQHTYPYNDSDYSQKEVSESSKQNNPLSDHHQTSRINDLRSQVKKFFSSMGFPNSQ